VCSTRGRTAVTQCNLPSFFLSFRGGWGEGEIAQRGDLHTLTWTGTAYLRSDLTDGQTDGPVWASGAEFSRTSVGDVIRIRVHVARSNFSAGIIPTLSRIIPALHLKCISITIIIVHVPGLVGVTGDFSMLPSLTALHARLRLSRSSLRLVIPS